MLGGVYVPVGGHVCDFKHHIRTHGSTVSILANHTKKNTVGFNRCPGALGLCEQQLGNSETRGVCSAFPHHFALGEAGPKGGKC